jgi:hypothetical protein
VLDYSAIGLVGSYEAWTKVNSSAS